MNELDIYKSELCGRVDDWTQLEPTFSLETLRTSRTSKVEVYRDVSARAKDHSSNLNHSPEEKARPASAYAIYFRECLPSVKLQHPDATFGDYSRLVAAQWDTLSSQKKKSYQLKSQRLRKDQIRSTALEAARKKVASHRQPLKSVNQ